MLICLYTLTTKSDSELNLISTARTSKETCEYSSMSTIVNHIWLRINMHTHFLPGPMMSLLHTSNSRSEKKNPSFLKKLFECTKRQTDQRYVEKAASYL